MLHPVVPYVLAELHRESPDTFTFRLKPADGSEIPDYQPGQFMQLLLTPSSDTKLMRSYSISSSPTRRGHLDLTIKIQGSFPQHLKELKAGHVFGLKGPFGRFYFEPRIQPDIVLLGAGVGVTPLMGMLRYALDLKLPNRITLLDVNKTEEDTIFRAELQALAAAAPPNFRIVRSYTRLAPEHPWKGERGRLDWDMLRRHVPEPLTKHYFLCGPDQMNRDVRALLLEKGVPKELVKLENMGI
jgi:ferredoxin-NADP reductase